MNDYKKFHHSVNVLLKAYLNDTLVHSNCYACAVGNLVADACGYVYAKAKDFPTRQTGLLLHPDTLLWRSVLVEWNNVFMTSEGTQHVQHLEFDGEAKRQIESTGYDWRQLAAIEFVFETANKGKNKDDHMFNGLMAVVDVLAQIHNIDLSTVKETKELFV